LPQHRAKRISSWFRQIRAPLTGQAFIRGAEQNPRRWWAWAGHRNRFARAGCLVAVADAIIGGETRRFRSASLRLSGIWRRDGTCAPKRLKVGVHALATWPKRATAIEDFFPGYAKTAPPRQERGWPPVTRAHSSRRSFMARCWWATPKNGGKKFLCHKRGARRGTLADHFQMDVVDLPQAKSGAPVELWAAASRPPSARKMSILKKQPVLILAKNQPGKKQEGKTCRSITAKSPPQDTAVGFIDEPRDSENLHLCWPRQANNESCASGGAEMPAVESCRSLGMPALRRGDARKLPRSLRENASPERLSPLASAS